MHRRRVIVESPYRGNVSENEEYARRCLMDCVLRGESPIAFHLLLTQILNDDIIEERQIGLECGFAWQGLADAVIVYIDKGYSEEMAAAANLALANDIPIEYRTIGNES